MENEVIKQVIVMRKDLGMRAGKMVAQGAHASMAVLLNSMEKAGPSWVLSLRDPALAEWVKGSFTKITVYVKSEEELLDIAKAAKDAGIRHALIQDAGKTEFKGVPTHTCVAIGPDQSEKIDKITGNLPLL